MQASAKVIADSIFDYGLGYRPRLTTMEVVMHRFVLAEFNTHRMFSRNSASSRAIPFQKQLNLIHERGIAIPVKWASEQKGMQGGDEILEIDAATAMRVWELAYEDAQYRASRLHELGVHKSICNRLLEPFMWHVVIVSSTEWENFWRQRCSPLAQPEIREAADAMRAAYEASTPTQLNRSDWHLPYIEERDLFDCAQCGERPEFVSAARCARVSYLTHDGKRDVQEDVAMYYRLISADPPHASPLEHVARPKTYEEQGQHTPGNFRGWVQLRHYVLGF